MSNNGTIRTPERCGVRPKSEQNRRKPLSVMKRLLPMLLWSPWEPVILSGSSAGGLKIPVDTKTLRLVTLTSIVS